MPARQVRGRSVQTRRDRPVMKIGQVKLEGRVLLAPMAGITDQPFRRLCRASGAALATSEMTTANRELWGTRKSRFRLRLDGELYPRSVQIAGSDPSMMADAARHAVDIGADIVDINMGCPAKKVLRKLAGSALLRDEVLVGRILDAVSNAVDVPVTLKTRTGWDPGHRNGVQVARLAESCGIQAIAVHGRTRECRFRGDAEYETIRQIKAAVSIPVIANGDIRNSADAAAVLMSTGADAVMIGRAVQGQPWLLGAIHDRLENRHSDTALALSERRDMMLAHLNAIHRFYGEDQGVKVARKHLVWYCQRLEDTADLRREIVRVDRASKQMKLLRQYFDGRCAGETGVEENSPPGTTNSWQKQKPASRLTRNPGNARTRNRRPSSRRGATARCAT